MTSGDCGRLAGSGEDGRNESGESFEIEERRRGGGEGGERRCNDDGCNQTCYHTKFFVFLISVWG
jgi:hypothetical protein